MEGHAPLPLPMGIDSDFSDTLMHVSGNIMRDGIAEQVKPFKNVDHISPGTRSESDDEENPNE